jgi:predicted HD superfamily hydrolase involved in NAD metabolism
MNYKDLILDIGLERYKHSLRVMDTALELGKIYKTNLENIKIASIYHDCGKIGSTEEVLKITDRRNIKLSKEDLKSPEVVHTVLGRYLAEHKYNIKDEDILNAIEFHTTGRPKMSLLEKIIYIADYTEPNRDFSGVEKVREASKKDIDNSMILALKNTIDYLKSKDIHIHKNTLDAYNYFIEIKGVII